ncbi:MAG: SDR family NAD(P)-dependent oxidoreductase, partial [Chloroflexi bacterium]|nr:SDR family NAD(P)-dependent oxidoreductase [Chloroflexota bacterium]
CLQAIQRQIRGRRIGSVYAAAGVLFFRTVLRSTLQEWSTTLAVNVVGVVTTIQTFAPVLREQREPSILCTVGSASGLLRGDRGVASYQSSKHAVVSLTDSPSFELAKSDLQIRVHALCPCYVATGMSRTSVVNQEVWDGTRDSASIQAPSIPASPLALTLESHAEDLRPHRRGRFYVITENVRPYVDHDRPFGVDTLIRERMESLLSHQIDNRDAFVDGPAAGPAATMKGSLFRSVESDGET